MEYIKSCGFVPYRVVDGAKRYLIIHSRNGDCGFPKGHMEPGETEHETAIRELKEELGVDGREEDLVFCGDRIIVWDDCFHGQPFSDRQHSRVFLMWLDLPEEAFCVDPEEVESVCWMDFDQCCQSVEQNRFPHCISMEELQLLRNVLK